MAGLLDQAAQLKQTDPNGYAQMFPQLHADIKSIDPEAAGHLDPNDPESLHIPAFGVHYASLKWGKQAADLIKQKADEQRAAAVETDRSLLAPAQRTKAIADAQLATDTAAGKKPIQPEEKARLDLQERAQEQTLTHNRATEQNAAALLRVHQAGDARAQQIYEQT